MAQAVDLREQERYGICGGISLSLWAPRRSPPLWRQVAPSCSSRPNKHCNRHPDWGTSPPWLAYPRRRPQRDHGAGPSCGAGARPTGTSTCSPSPAPSPSGSSTWSSGGVRALHVTDRLAPATEIGTYRHRTPARQPCAHSGADRQAIQPHHVGLRLHPTTFDHAPRFGPSGSISTPRTHPRTPPTRPRHHTDQSSALTRKSAPMIKFTGLDKRNTASVPYGRGVPRATAQPIAPSRGVGVPHVRRDVPRRLRRSSPAG